ncbi:hypothetical protein [Rodentibacter caecimuris]|uniref:hypothetical protein n=1 Tax=Rodentibacter caecimuris TaxID=1796644 RepID=UPI0009851C84|nr:hypothetical protein [Rodentibacter heylii]OOF81441.1 hypothetical protein BKG97_03485 [Rodentibacter heylii]QIA77661.1 hypothetical protein FEE42_10065 [Rodentibacter heylii]
MYSRAESIRVIDKLIELTQHGQLKWEETPPSRYMSSTTENVDVIYQAYYQDVYINVYNRKYRYYYDETEYSWDDDVIIELLNTEGVLLNRLPNTPNADELLSSIRYQNRALQNFYKNILNG